MGRGAKVPWSDLARVLLANSFLWANWPRRKKAVNPGRVWAEMSSDQAGLGLKVSAVLAHYRIDLVLYQVSNRTATKISWTLLSMRHYRWRLVVYQCRSKCPIWFFNDHCSRELLLAPWRVVSSPWSNDSAAVLGWNVGSISFPASDQTIGWEGSGVHLKQWTVYTF